MESMVLSFFPWGEEIAIMLSNYLKCRQSLTAAPSIFTLDEFLFPNSMTLSERKKKISDFIDPKFTSTTMDYDNLALQALKNVGFAAIFWHQLDLLIELLCRLRDEILSHDEIYVHLLLRATVLDAPDSVRETVKYISYSELLVRVLLKQAAS